MDNKTIAKPRLSIIIPVYNEEENLDMLYKNLVSTASGIAKYDFEFIFIDDCSMDRTPDILEGFRKADARIAIIRFAHNSGSHAADAAGLYYCGGDIAIIMPADMQDIPERVIPKLVEQWENGYKVVWGVHESRKGESFMAAFFSLIFYFLTNVLTDIKQPPTGVGTILLDRIVIGAFNQLSEKNPSIIMMIAWLGFPQTQVRYVSEERRAGKSKWTLAKKIKLSLDSLVSFSYIPMRFMSLMGVVCTMLGTVYCIYIFINKLLNNVAVQGWSSIMIALLFIGGIQMVMLGILGEYLWRAYDESRGRPRYVIERNTIKRRGSWA